MRLQGNVLPAQAGMIPGLPECDVQEPGAPRAGGDDPASKDRKDRV